MRKFIIAALMGVCSAGSVLAMDLGVQGNAWPIVEIDFRQLMLESAARVDWNNVNTEVKESVNKFFDGMPRRNLPSAEKTETRYIDPSVTTSSDIMAPIPDKDGNYQWTKLYAKGTKVNPLEKYRPLTAMLFFDGSDEAQLAFVKEALDHNPMRIVPVETAGANVKALSTVFKRPIFYANDAMMARFRIANLPSILYAASGEYSMYMGLTAFAAPYKVAELESVWPVEFKAGSPVIPMPAVTDKEREAITNLLKLSPKGTPNAVKN